MRNLLFHGLAWGMVTAAVASALWVARQAGADGLDGDTAAGAVRSAVAAPAGSGQDNPTRRLVGAADGATAGAAVPQALSADDARSLLRR